MIIEDERKKRNLAFVPSLHIDHAIKLGLGAPLDEMKVIPVNRTKKGYFPIWPARDKFRKKPYLFNRSQLSRQSNSNLLEDVMKMGFQKVPLSKAPGDFLIPLEALKPLPLQSRDVLKQLPPPFPLKTLRR